MRLVYLLRTPSAIHLSNQFELVNRKLDSSIAKLDLLGAQFYIDKFIVTNNESNLALTSLVWHWRVQFTINKSHVASNQFNFLLTSKPSKFYVITS